MSNHGLKLHHHLFVYFLCSTRISSPLGRWFFLCVVHCYVCSTLSRLVTQYNFEWLNENNMFSFLILCIFETLCKINKFHWIQFPKLNLHFYFKSTSVFCLCLYASQSSFFVLLCWRSSLSLPPFVSGQPHPIFERQKIIVTKKDKLWNQILGKLHCVSLIFLIYKLVSWYYFSVVLFWRLDGIEFVNYNNWPLLYVFVASFLWNWLKSLT